MTAMEWSGIGVGIFTLLVIGFGHFWVKKLESHIGAQVWPGVVVVGTAFIFGSFLVPHWLPSTLLGILGFTTLWGAKELVELSAKRRQENG